MLTCSNWDCPGNNKPPKFNVHAQVNQNRKITLDLNDIKCWEFKCMYCGSEADDNEEISQSISDFYHQFDAMSDEDC